MASLALTSILVATLALQAFLPSRRLLIVTAGAAASCLAASLAGVATTRTILAGVPWDVLVILVGLGLFSELIAETRAFSTAAVAVTRRSAADPRRVLVLACGGMFLVSGLVNNLTALLLVLPILLILFRLLAVEQRYVSWGLGALLVSCNLGGAATPIGDFPAILLLGSGAMGFGDYLVRAFPPALFALVIVVGLVAFVVRPYSAASADPVSRRLSVSIMEALHRNVRVDRSLLVPLAAVLALMLAAWIAVPASSGIGPELICWLGIATALAIRPRAGERAIRTRVDVEAVLFLLSLFVMVVAVSHSGAFGAMARGIRSLPVPPRVQLVAFLLLAGVATALFSAGPAMAALLEVADALTLTLPSPAVYVGLALSVCAGSSFLLTAATSGPMAQMLTERAGLRDGSGRRIRFGFFEFLPVGLMSFGVIECVAIAYGVLAS